MSNNQSALFLVEYMQALSEEAYTANWMTGLEYALWYAVNNGPMSYGRLIINQDHINRLVELSNKCGGWFVYDDDREEIFIPLNEWEILYKNNFDENKKYITG
ncbi:MAG: hypothetical protein AAGA18_15485 [Verrucomicrobiota bacterium]